MANKPENPQTHALSLPEGRQLIRDAKLNGSRVENTFLEKTTFHRVDLSEAKIIDSRAPGIRFLEVNLSGAEFDDVNLQGANFHNVNLRGASFDDVNLQGATITNANIRGMTIFGIPVEEALESYRKAHQ